MAYIKSRWNPNCVEESKLTLSPKWKELSDIAKLDHLKDTLFDIENLYNSTLAGFLKNKQ